MSTQEAALVYECVKSRFCQDEWVVEAINYAQDGEIYSATFSGPGAEDRAKEYAGWKNRLDPAAKPLVEG